MFHHVEDIPVSGTVKEIYTLLQAWSDGKEAEVLCQVYTGLFTPEENEVGEGLGKGKLI